MAKPSNETGDADANISPNEENSHGGNADIGKNENPPPPAAPTPDESQPPEAFWAKNAVALAQVS